MKIFKYGILCCLYIILFCSACGNKKSGFVANTIHFPADGVSGGVVEYFANPEDDITTCCAIENKDVIRITAVKKKDKSLILYYFKSTEVPGRAVFRSGKGESVTLYFAVPGIDSDADGFPDSAELNNESDRRAFRKWFVRIAESQFATKSPAWEKDQHDCAGLIRLAYREALKRHDDRWRKRFGFVPDGNIRDVESFNYPDVPVVGDLIFRVKNLKPDKSSFGAFADAATLLSLNTVPAGRDPASAEEGDVLFFANPEDMRWPYHSMIFAGRERNKYYFIYHTGEGGMVKRVDSDYLRDSGRFNPVPNNPDFLGIYRFRILE